MRQEEQQVSNDHPEAVRPHRSRCRRPTTGPAGADVPEDALDDRGTFDDPAVADGDTDGSDRRRRSDDRVHRRTATDATGGFHEPGPLPTVFGATTVGGAVAASALATPAPGGRAGPAGRADRPPGRRRRGRRAGGPARRPDRRVAPPGRGRATAADDDEVDADGRYHRRPPRVRPSGAPT